MAPPRSRLRKQQRKKIDRTPWLILSSSTVLLVIFYLISVVIDDSGPHFDDNGSSEREMVAQCSESCSEVILSREDILSLPQDSLAFSAADALFSFREGDEDDYSITTVKRQNYGKQQGRNIRQSKNNVISSHSDMYRNLSPRPTRLPLLIETLVGAIESNEDFGMLPQGDFAAGTRQGRNDRIHSPRREVNISTRPGDDSVAMVAAAAAAALWSESENKQGRLRMKAFNDEWESSLRWIASWGQHQHGNKAIVDHSTNMNSSRAHLADRESSRKKRQKEGDLGKETQDIEHLNSDEYPGFSELLDACVAQCTVGTRETHMQDSSSGRVNVSEIRSNAGDIINFRTMIFAVKSISSPFVFSSDYLRSLANIQLIKSLLGMAISTAIMLGIRNLTDWWRHKTSLRLLLEEENYQEKIDCGRHKKNKVRTAGKKSASKKTRRKRKEILHVRKSYISVSSILEGNCEEHEDISLSSEESVNRSMSIREGSKQTANCSDDHSEDQWSKDHASSASTYSSLCIACDADPEFCLIQAGSNISRVATEATLPTVHFLRQCKSKKRIVHVTESQSNLFRELNKALSPITQRVQLKIEPNIPDFPLKEVARSEPYTLAKFDQDNVIIATPDSPSVPTKEQREEASRALREFQLTQVRKYIKAKQAQRSGSNHVSSKTTPLRTLVHANSYFEPEALHDVSPDRYGRKVWMEETYKPAPQSESNTAKYPNLEAEPSLGVGTDVGQSILNMLDESDDELEYNIASKESRIAFSAETTNEELITSPVKSNKKSTEEQSQFRSIALGNLLTPKNKTFSSVSSNPWSIKHMDSPCIDLKANRAFRNQSPTHSFDGSSDHPQELEGHTTEYTDANICLQVSAREFSPSWDGGHSKGNHAQVW